MYSKSSTTPTSSNAMRSSPATGTAISSRNFVTREISSLDSEKNDTLMSIGLNPSSRISSKDSIT